jgi:hypothetical protein
VTIPNNPRHCCTNLLRCTVAGNVKCAGPRVPCSAGPEDGTRGARRDACPSLYGLSNDIGVGLYHWIPLWTLYYQTHARCGVKHCSSGNGLRQMIPGSVFLVADATGGSVPDPPCVGSYVFEWHPAPLYKSARMCVGWHHINISQPVRQVYPASKGDTVDWQITMGG